MIAPSLRSIMPGSTARMVRIIALTLRSKAKSRSKSVMSRIEPAWTKPAQLNSTSTAPISANHLRHFVGLEHVEFARLDVRFLRQRIEQLLIDVRRVNNRAFARESQNRSPANTLPSGRYENAFAFKLTCHFNLHSAFPDASHALQP